LATIRKPKHKICRTVGYCIYNEPKCPSVKRPYPPGQKADARKKKKSPYGEQLLEKQKLRLTYGMLEKQFYRIFDARQLINHGHVTVDGRRVDIPSFHVKSGQVIGLISKSQNLDRVKMGMETRVSATTPTPYIEIQNDGVSGKFIGINSAADIPISRINVQKIVEFYSK
jgi:small subunit ribosomal protein S4